MEGIAAISKEEWCRRFVEHMVSEAGFETFNNGVKVRGYAEFAAPDYWYTNTDNTPEDAAEADMDCWEDGA